MRIRVLITAFAIALATATAVLASTYADLIRSQESGGNYGALNSGGGTAAGAYQITAGTLASLGYVRYTGGSRGNWANYEWTSQSQAAGVTSLSGFLNSSAGHALQDRAFSELTSRNLASLSSSTRGLIGQTVGGVEITESGLLTAAHFLGAGALNDWVASGFDPTVFPPEYLSANGFSSYDELQAHLLNRMGGASGTQFAGGFGTGGTYVRIPMKPDTDSDPRFRSEVHHRQALFEMRAQARKKGLAVKISTGGACDDLNRRYQYPYSRIAHMRNRLSEQAVPKRDFALCASQV